MTDGTAIEWTHRPGTKGETWNPVVGCSIVSPGCTNCYAMKMAARIEAMGTAPHYAGTTKKVNGKAVWTGKLAPAPEKTLTAPLRWKTPRTVFVNSMSDLFHEDAPDEWIDRVFAVMALCPQHTFQVLTKRADRMRSYLDGALGRIAAAIQPMRTDDNRVVAPLPHIKPGRQWWPLANVWLGVSAERQKEADERIPLLLETPAAIRFVSAEPLLGPIDLDKDGAVNDDSGASYLRPWGRNDSIFPGLDWIIGGGESGPNARPMHPNWARSLRDQCTAAGVPFFFKQFGAWVDTSTRIESAGGSTAPDVAWPDGSIAWGTAAEHGGLGIKLNLVGKKAAGRLLDGREWNEYPEARA